MSHDPGAVTFDFHDTIASCNRWFELEVRELMPAFLRWYSSEHHRPFDPELAHQSKLRYRDLRRDVMRHGREVDAASAIEAITRDLGIMVPEESIHRGLSVLMGDALRESTPVPGVVEAVRSLRGHGLMLGVVSSAAFHPFIEWSLEKFGILDAFDAVVSSASSGYYKSRPEIYTIALNALNARAERTVHIGDSLVWDVEAASRLGMKTIWYNTGNAQDSSDGADVVVSTLVGVQERALQLLNGRCP